MDGLDGVLAPSCRNKLQEHSGGQRTMMAMVINISVVHAWYDSRHSIVTAKSMALRFEICKRQLPLPFPLGALSGGVIKMLERLVDLIVCGHASCSLC